jgi:hypothetical protein
MLPLPVQGGFLLVALAIPARRDYRLPAGGQDPMMAAKVKNGKNCRKTCGCYC